MSQEIIIIDSAPVGQARAAGEPLGVIIGAWLHEKRQRSQSERTERAYQETLASFRQFLRQQGRDLDSQGDLTDYLQVWAGQPGAKRDRNGRLIKPVKISPATFKQRVAIVSSFYRFAIRRKKLKLTNPAEGIDRGKRQPYARAQPLRPEEVKAALKAIDLNTLAGQRDYALLHVALETGRRRAELAGLRYGDLQQQGGQVLVTWQRAKGGKVMHDLLPRATSQALMRYLHAIYGANLGTLPNEAPVWIALRPSHYGHALSTQAIADICLEHLKTSKVHATRHTFAHSMEAIGAKVSDIQARLGHASIATTGEYLAALKSAYNPQAEELAALFGAEEEGIMDQGDRLDPPTTSAFSAAGEPRTCYRCGKPEEAARPLRLLPGSAHIIVCPECYQFLWGWKEQKGTL